MTAICVSMQKTFKVLAADSAVSISATSDEYAIRDKIWAFDDSNSFASVVGSETLLTTLWHLYSWAKLKSAEFHLNSEENVLILEEAFERVQRFQNENFPDMAPLTDTTLILFSNQSIEILNFSACKEFKKLKLKDRAQLSEQKTYVFYGDEMAEITLVAEDEKLGPAEIRSALIGFHENRKINGPSYLKHFGKRLSSVQVFDDALRSPIVLSPFSCFMDQLIGPVGGQENFDKLQDPYFQWSPF